MKKISVILFVLLFILKSSAAIVTKEISYSLDTVTFKGFLAYDNSIKGKRPGILVAHEWWGLNDFTRTQAKRLAELGYTAFAVDMYGNGKNTSDPKEAASLAGGLRGNPVEMRKRINAGFATLTNQEQVDPAHTAAIGFCFGGSAILGLAYSGAKVNGIVTFHGGLFSPRQEDLGNIKPRFLFLHGAEDPTVPRDTIMHMEEELSKAGADWQMVFYSNTVHSFTNPASGNDKSKGVAYNPLSAQRSWKHMELFLKELFPSDQAAVHMPVSK